METSNSLTIIEQNHPALQPSANPAVVYLASLGPGSRRAMRQALGVISELLTGTKAEPLQVPWWNVQYQHSQAIRSLLMENYSPASTNKMLAALRGVLRESWRLGFMDAETFHRAIDIKTVKGNAIPKGRSVGSGEINALVEVCFADPPPAGVRDAAILALLYAAGLRRSEVVVLDLADYDSETGSLKILASKGNKARTVYLGNGAKAAMTGWINIRGDKAGPLLHRIRKGGKIIPERLTDQAIWVILEKRFKQAKVKPFTPHDLRRTFAGEMLDAGVDLVTVQKLMGHASPVTTSRYDRRNEKTKMEAATKIHFPM
ncbi:MAG: tyrosine-type recombinase/integrase, partial [SAR324 cluster bacterium]|nr:tyrosine-type recombinase/integrase [SAR324 cluster bacterium]